MVVKLDNPRGAYARLTAAPVTRSVIQQVLASRSGALDAWRLGTEAAPASPTPSLAAGSIPYVLSWPPEAGGDTRPDRAVPNVTGLTLRQAAGTLHRSGFQVRVRGWGVVTSMSPAPGSQARSGAVVTVVASAPGRR
jgi:hypothetical protein